ncbi:hypothetical protein T439DRAFT_353903 [Meredithblackwellia eburnea MCA 4105]
MKVFVYFHLVTLLATLAVSSGDEQDFEIYPYPLPYPEGSTASTAVMTCEPLMIRFLAPYASSKMSLDLYYGVASNHIGDKEKVFTIVGKAVSAEDQFNIPSRYFKDNDWKTKLYCIHMHGDTGKEQVSEWTQGFKVFKNEARNGQTQHRTIFGFRKAAIGRGLPVQ